jgi:large subunit ribosomal protein L29
MAKGSKKKVELSSLTPEELTKKEQDLRKELFNLRMQKSTGQLEDVKSIGRVKKDIARTLTYLGQKKLSAQPAEAGK